MIAKIKLLPLPELPMSFKGDKILDVGQNLEFAEGRVREEFHPRLPPVTPRSPGRSISADGDQPSLRVRRKIRPAHPGEAAALSQLAFRAKSHWGYSSAQMEAWRDALTIPEEWLRDQHVHVACLDEEPAGFFAVVVDPAGCRLEHLWVETRSMRRGIGRALLQKACDVAKSHGNRHIRQVVGWQRTSRRAHLLRGLLKRRVQGHGVSALGKRSANPSFLWPMPGCRGYATVVKRSLAADSGARQLCGSSEARSLFFSVGSRSSTSFM